MLQGSKYEGEGIFIKIINIFSFFSVLEIDVGIANITVTIMEPLSKMCVK